MRRLVKSKKILRNQNHNELYTTPSLTGGCCIFYTDFHGVDEDMATISRDGGWWNHEIHAGAEHRDLLDTPTTSEVNVASKCRH